MKTTKELLIEKTFFLMIEKGYDKFSVSDIQKSLGMSRSVLYKHFKTKSELVFETCKHYFFEMFFPNVDELDKVSFKEFMDRSNQNFRKLFKNFSKNSGVKISVLKYNILFIEVMKHESLFNDFIHEEYSRLLVVLRNAKARGEIKKNVSDEFIRNVFSDIYCRATDVFKRGEANMLEDIIRDVESFYDLIKA